MKIFKILIMFNFLLAFAVCVSAQEPTLKIVWNNLQEKYESFYDIEPQIVNFGDDSIYYDSYYFPFVDFERFEETSGTWKVSRVWRCGTGYRPRIRKIKPNEQIYLGFGKIEWDEIINEDSIGTHKFRKFPEYSGTGKYRFRIKLGTKKSNVNQLFSYSPEFLVVEKDFKK